MIRDTWEVEYTDEFERWWDALPETAQDAVSATVSLLERFGPHLGFPHSSQIRGSRLGNLRELRVQESGSPLRVLYAFDPRRTAVLLLGGDKTGDDRWYHVHVPIAERLYDVHLSELREEGGDGEEIP
ncbi:MAG TPA: type II toxin-antitoxin system RelE/ParE family toxin [Longimicrobium sp.]|nr:type II toxin-antitoxin system RelE/ParE family toxin [Longimicrobium sp.]